jgi:asparaginyl-tRNA synthetase
VSLAETSPKLPTPALQTKTIDALDIVRESTVEITGTLKVPLEGKTAEGGHELIADWWKTIGTAPGGEEAFVSRVPDVSIDL